MRTRSFCLGLVLGGALAATPFLLGAGSGSAPGPEDLDAGGEAGSSADRSELDRLRDENARLQKALEAARGNGRAEVETAEANAGSEDDAEATEASAGQPIDPIEAGNKARALEFLLAEVREMLEFGLLAERYGKEPIELGHLVLQIWMQLDKPERALRVMQALFEIGFDADNAHWVAQALAQKGDKIRARDALLLGLKKEPTNWGVINLLATIDPELALQSQAELLASSSETNDQVDHQRALLLLSAKRTTDALALIDRLISEGKMSDGTWDNLVRLDPTSAVARLRKFLEASPDQVQHRLRLVTALRTSGDTAGARTEIDTMLAQAPDNQAAVQAFGELDRNAALRWLESRIAGTPTGATYGLYGAQLQAAGRQEDAINAYYQAFQLEPNSGHHYQLLRMAPARFANQMAETARQRKDDEFLGDIADALWPLGQRERALALWDEALRLDPGDGEWVNKVRKARAGEDPFN
ncbi:MAG: tetratricopeptide repeat protein [Planctomycetota bacterium]